MNKIYQLFFLFLISCSGQNAAMSTLEKEVKSALYKVSHQEFLSARIYIIIPRAGCGGCISTGENFMLNTLKSSNKSNLTFVLTDFDSEKLLRVRFGNIYHNKNVYVDPNNLFKANPNLNSIYPTIYFFDKDAQLIKVSEISPNKDGLTDILNFQSVQNKL